MKIKFGIVQFPGSNCDFDSYRVAKEILSADAEFLWHKERDLKNSDVIILPGGFSYGDYIRTGSIARFSPIMEEVIKFANSGGIVLGICNGFQILLEAGLLPGVMLKNESLKFISKDAYVHVENRDSIFTSEIKKNVLKIPVAHAEGNYFAKDDVLKQLEGEGRILFKYSSPDGTVAEEFNPNGSKLNIAGIINEKGNVLGMMPHPERCSDNLLGNDDGLGIFSSILKNVSK
jgi:phosphoribosylformylglycinamidine synthase I